MLYLFACISPQCIKRSDCVKAYRCIVHDRNPHVTFANDEDYKFVIDRADAILRTSRLAALYDNAEANGENDSSNDEDERKEDTVVDSGAGAATAKRPATKFGAMTFKPRLTEYLIDSSEEAMADTLFYVR